jgi:hypothetical protein
LQQTAPGHYCSELRKYAAISDTARPKVARFRRINMGKPNVHHDALEFPDGEIVLLTRLCEGQHATVLQLPASPRPVNAAERQKGDSLVR